MDQDYEHKKRLWSQLTEAYAKEIYSRETQNVAANCTKKLNSGISIAQIVLTSIAAVGFISALLPSAYIATVLAAACSAVALGLNLYSRGAKLPEESAAHVKASNDLWAFEQKMISLLTDFDELKPSEICAKRDQLFEELDAVYRSAPRTSDRQYKKARNMLKESQAQSFDDGEVDSLLPANLRHKYKS
ncbi:MAG: SLATT domain-containing protein [Atopobiaceae bacterium]|jgi:hypothetical protein|nr:SLATT domain-containing protein [Atopobiaceae bacterium]